MNHLDDILLVGTGKMGVEYAKVLQDLNVSFTVIGRSRAGVEIFKKLTGKDAFEGGIEKWILGNRDVPQKAIVAVSVETLAETTLLLLKKGVKKILLEKPAGLNLEEIKTICSLANDKKVPIQVAYNRRFYASLLKAQEIIRADGGVKSFHFDFTEWGSSVCDDIKNDAVKKNWILANSSHVIDMAFFLGGKPCEMQSFVSGGLSWHPSGSIYTGSGISETGALFSYHANWDSPGRWGVEIMTPVHRLVFRPLEKLQIQKHKTVVLEFVEIDNSLDTRFKPGLYKQTDYFLRDVEHENFIDIHEHYQDAKNFLSLIGLSGHGTFKS